MKVLGNVLLAGALAVGALAAATAYLVPLDLPDEELVGLTLSADAGAVPGPNHPLLRLSVVGLGASPLGAAPLSAASALPAGTAKPEAKGVPMLRAGKSLTPKAVAWLRAEGVSYVRVRQFEWQWWPGRWWFVAALAGLLVAAGLLRTASRQEIATAGATRDAELPERALRAVKEAVDHLWRDVPGLPESEQLQAILARLGEAQRTDMPAFVEARPLLIARLGLGGFAELMDRYAAAERQINRAWSAAADGVLAEAVRCLELASVFLDEALDRLSRR
jgi:hypothetical protein